MLNNLKLWAQDLFPINRSLTGKGNVITLRYIKKINKKLKIKSTRTNNKIFDWKIPNEWNVKSATLKDEYGNIICDFSRNNLELVGYSMPVKKTLKYKDLLHHLHYNKKFPTAIPYVTSYYKKNWGFCLSYLKFLKLKKNIKYHVDIKSSMAPGKMHYGEIYLKGKSKKEILITSYICHPSMANNELSGILALIYLSKIIVQKKYSIRFLFIPETIGAIYYIKKNIKNIKSNLVAGINITCVGTAGPFTIINSINKNSYSDIISRRVGRNYKNFRELDFIFRGSNERQFGCQNLDLPFVSFCRQRFGDYKEYHTSHDNLSIMNFRELKRSIKFVNDFIKEIERNKIYLKNKPCEPFLTKYKIIDPLATKANMNDKNRIAISNIIAYVSKKIDITEISKILKISNTKINKNCKLLVAKKIIKEFL